jgi:putative oxidoreductase
MNALHMASHGLGQPDIALTLIRVATGAFFACSGWNKLTNTGRHAGMVKTMVDDHVPAITFNQWWVPAWEYLGGMMMVLGIFSAFAAGVLFVICAVACKCEATKRVKEYQPINKVDVLADYLYLPEVLYCLMLIITILAGGGPFSVTDLF